MHPAPVLAITLSFLTLASTPLAPALPVSQHGLSEQVMGPQGQRARVQGLLDRAKKALDAKEDTRALIILRQAWRLEPGYAKTAELYEAAMMRVGTRFLDEKEYARATDIFRQGCALFPKSAAIALGAGQTALEIRDTKKAEAQLRRAVDLDTRLVPAHIALGSLLYADKRFDEAHVFLKRALQLDPGNKVALSFLRKNSDDRVVERRFAERESKHFKLSYHGERRGLDKHQPEILAYLEACYERMIKLLRRKPKHRIEVVLYTKTEFRILNRNADWVAAYYDGRVRIPLDSWPLTKQRVMVTIRHELTHAFLHQLYGDVSSWMHEGIAQRVDGSDLQEAQKRVEEIPFFSAERLRRSFVQERNPKKARLLYDQSLLVFHEIERRLGSRGVTPLFERLSKDETIKKHKSLAAREDYVLKKLLGYDLAALIRVTARARGAAMPSK